MTARSHLLDIYGIQLHLATNKAEWKQLRRQHTWLSKTPDALGLSWFNAGHPCHLVLWVDVDRHETTADVVDTCGHEAAHGATSILEHCGHERHDEPHAYLVGWLTRWIWQGVNDGAPSLR